MRDIRRHRLIGIVLAALVVVGIGLYFVGEADRLPWRSDPTETAITPVEIPGAGTPATSPESAPIASACWDEEPTETDGLLQWSGPPATVIDPETTGYLATLETNRGDITVELLARDAPVTVNNFVCLARGDYYEDTPFHRVLAGFVIQSGDPTGTGTGGPGYQIEDELPEVLDYSRGMLAMANSGPNTSGSQFFVVLDDIQGQLPKNYSIFGTVTEGMEVVDEIAAVPVEPGARGELSSP
ncbi:MAG: peptidylprolyl isomerase, partial [Chloroflexota bacterium]|nr:peptidylprolyl isomerase [Chloroflexota bacterium]